MNEWDLIQNFKQMIPRNLQGELGIGDDADFLNLPSSSLVCASDVIVENVDFRLKEATPEEIGYKALAVNLSDLAAMGAKPVAYLVALGLPKSTQSFWVKKLYQGILTLAKKYKMKCLGGDLSSSNEVFISITVLGVPFHRHVITRSGAKKGDLIAVTGTLGGSIKGRHLNFEPRLKESEFLSKNFKISSMIDLSDGLAQDLEHVLKSSKVGAFIHLEQIPISGKANGIKEALSDGEDFELLFTLQKSEKKRLDQMWRKKFPRLKLSWLGEIVTGKPMIAWKSGEEVVKNFSLQKKGYSHFL